MLWSLLACGAKDTVPEVAPEPVQTEPVVAEPMEGPGPPGGMPGRDPVYSPNGLCVGDEQVVFSCLLDDGRLASLCGTDTLQARIGTIGSVAVKMPAAPIERALFVLSEDGSRASFSNGRLSLSVFSAGLILIP